MNDIHYSTGLILQHRERGLLFNKKNSFFEVTGTIIRSKTDCGRRKKEQSLIWTQNKRHQVQFSYIESVPCQIFQVLLAFAAKEDPEWSQSLGQGITI